jgi:hypothetical protein
LAKIFNGRAATEEYMSTHSLTFSTPEMTLRKFALWLGEQVSQQASGSSEPVPRLMLYIEEKQGERQSEFAPVVDDSFKPTGAVTEMYKSIDTPAISTDALSPPQIVPIDRETLEPEAKFCISCGSRLKINAKFCTKCGSAQS